MPDPINMTTEQELLWKRIKAFEIDDPGAALTFTDRLARENGWTLEYAIRVADEYKKFMFLLCIAKHPLTPSDQVDQAWHLHLIYTESYWKEFCGEILGRQIHHGPTKGGVEESGKFTDWYEKTKQLYAETFDYMPPGEIWPQSKIRFSEINFIRVNTDNNWILKKPKLFKK